MQEVPIVSVVIPTCRRPFSLQKAVDSVFGQTFPDWELIVSDDEKPPGVSWRWLEKVAAKDHRVHPVRHKCGQGQVENTNFGMAHARGVWLKILHDDDWLLPDALHALVNAARNADEKVVLITARVCKEGRRLKRNKQKHSEVYLRYAGNEAIFRMYMQEESGGTIPSSMMIRGDLFRSGVRFDAIQNCTNIVDAWYKVLLLIHGDLLHVNDFLVIKSEADHNSITNSTGRADLDREMEVLRDMMLPHVDTAFIPPPVDVVKGKVKLIRAMHRLSRRYPVEAFKLAISVHRPLAWVLAFNWLLWKIKHLDET